jgi:hypothetical protein
MSKRYLIAIGLLLLSVAAEAGTTCVSGGLAPGSQVCTFPPQLANSSASVSGSSLHTKKIRWLVFWQGDTDNPLFDDKTETGISESWDSTTDPGLFPGFFQACAKRPESSTTSETITLCLTTN